MTININLKGDIHDDRGLKLKSVLKKKKSPNLFENKPVHVMLKSGGLSDFSFLPHFWFLKNTVLFFLSAALVLQNVVFFFLFLSISINYWEYYWFYVFFFPLRQQYIY